MSALRGIRRSLTMLICSASIAVLAQSQSKVRPAQANSHGGLAGTARAFILGELPVQFEENVGQAGEGVRFLARGRGYNLLLNPGGVVLNLSQSTALRQKSVAMQLLGSRPAVDIAGRQQTSTLTNYYIGKDPSLWHTNVRSYRSVVYTNVYDGIDAVYHGNGNQLEYDFIIAPGADPHQVRMAFNGLAPQLRDGRLSFEDAYGFTVEAPHAYQVVGGEKKPVEASWLLSGNEASIHLGSYDPREQLVIDPVFFYGAYIGGENADSAVSIVPAGKPGIFYVALSTASPTITAPPNGGEPNDPNSTGTDTVIVGLDASDSVPPSAFPPYTKPVPDNPSIVVGSVTYLGDITGSTVPTAMVADSQNNLYITGLSTDGASFPELASEPCSQSCDGYVAKFATSLSGNLTLSPPNPFGLPAKPSAIAVDTTGNIYLTGTVTTGSGVNQLTPTDKDFQSQLVQGTALTSGTHAFLLEIDSTGKTAFASNIGGSGTDQGNAIVLSGTTAYIAGQTSSPKFPTSSGAFQTGYGGDPHDAFVMAIGSLPATPSLIFSTYVGGANDDSASSVALAPSGSVIIAGSTNSSQDFPVENNASFSALSSPGVDIKFTDSNQQIFHHDGPPTSPPVPTKLPPAIPDGLTDAFVTSLTSDGTQLNFTDFLGGSGPAVSVTSARSVKVDNIGAVYVTGTSSATGTFTDVNGNAQFDFLSGHFVGDTRQYSGDHNVFFGEIDPSGKFLLEATLAGGTGTDLPNDMTISDPTAANGVASIVGSTVPSQTSGAVGTPDLFASDISSDSNGSPVNVLYPINPTPPPTKTDDDTTGFFVQEAIAGFCDMKLIKQSGSKLEYQGPCVTGTQEGFLLISYTDNTKNPANQNVAVPFPIIIKGGALVGDIAEDISTVVGKSNFSISFAFEPYGAIGGAGTCQNNGDSLSGCSVNTSGGGSGTLFDITNGALTIALSCTGASCNYDGQPDTVLSGQAVTLNAGVVNGIPDTVSWSSSLGTFTGPNPATSIQFTPSVSGQQVAVSAVSTADASVPAKVIELNVLQTPTLSLTDPASGSHVYGNPVSIHVTSNAFGASPAVNFVCTLDGAASPAITGCGSTSMTITSLSAGMHNLAVSYPGNYKVAPIGGFLTATSATIAINVGQASLTVQATDASVTYGQSIPGLTFTIIGFQYADTEATIGGAPVETTTATNNSPVGTYPITITQGTLGQNTSNYTYAFKNGTLTVESLGTAPPPSITPGTGTYTAAQTVSIGDSNATAVIYYTADGSTPTASSTRYSAPFLVSSTKTIRAIAVAPGFGASGVSTVTLTLSPPTLSPVSLDFNGVVVETSATQATTLTNQGKNQLLNLTLAISGTSASDFKLGSLTTCGTTLAAGGSCTISVIFTPATVATGFHAGITVGYSGIGSPQSLAVSGDGLSPLSIASPPTELIAGTSFQFRANQQVTWIASAGTIDSSGLFTAPSSVPSPPIVTITATSVASTTLSASAQVTIAAPPAISVADSTTLAAGKSVTIPFTLAAGTGISGESYNLACTPATLPSDVTCTFTPDPVINGAGGATGALVITSNVLTSGIERHRRPGEPGFPVEGSVLAIAGLVLLGIRRRIDGKKWWIATILLASSGLLSISACGTSGSFKVTSKPGYATGTFGINVVVTGATSTAADYNQTVNVFTVNVTIQ